ncbi:MAG TPA: hypothetical protein VK469_22780 [Candidatus Kapabacteria bacterium]|nr:hypothetical protein [Candidatus Kapabacteria bacterium]
MPDFINTSFSLPFAAPAFFFFSVSSVCSVGCGLYSLLHPVMQEVVKYRARPDAKKCKVLINSLKWKLRKAIKKYLKDGGDCKYKVYY